MNDSQHIRTIVDNDEATYAVVMDAVYDHLRDNIGYDDMTAEQYRQESARDSMAYHLRWTVRDVIYESLTRDVGDNSLPGQALAVFLDYSNASLWEDVAECYVPSVEDYAEHFGEEIA